MFTESIFDVSEHQMEVVIALLRESSIGSASMRSIRQARTLSNPRQAVSIQLQDRNHRLSKVDCSHSAPELLLQQELDQLVAPGYYVPSCALQLGSGLVIKYCID